MNTIQETISRSPGDYADLFGQLLTLGQTFFSKPTDGISQRLCQQVAEGTQGSAALLLLDQNEGQHRVSTRRAVPSSEGISFSVEFCQRTYGTLHVVPDAADPAFPGLPLHVAHLLARLCGWLLYTFELASLLEGQCQRLEQQVPAPLTKRERQVLLLICRGYQPQAIAASLHITPATLQTYRKRLSQKLGVHSERDLPLAAYQHHLFPLLEGIPA